MPGQTSVNNSVKKALGKRSKSQTVEAPTTVSIARLADLPLLWGSCGGISPLFLKDRPGDPLLALVVFPFQVVQVDHGGVDIAVAQQLLGLLE